ncbi:LPS assembly lipoprotein LptE [Pseudooceanicola onchidii]|uniref:LPS assembly lipoprotein LptE n=1 Tax=Pseudooceanicola onchidii TaxID=2562279 RepID=UPI001F116EE4|nr:LPS assembly lipoprotein LptE [Pseudooceanicola onchidii]
MMLAATPLAACGFAPAYGPQGGAQALTRAIEVKAPVTRTDYLMTRQLEDRLGRTDAGDYLLDYTLTLEEERIAITANNITRRFNLIGSADYRLTTPDGTLITKGNVESFVGYSTTGSTVATRAARADAEERLTTILADRIVTRLIAAAPTLPIPGA